MSNISVIFSRIRMKYSMCTPQHSVQHKGKFPLRPQVESFIERTGGPGAENFLQNQNQWLLAVAEQ